MITKSLGSMNVVFSTIEGVKESGFPPVFDVGGITRSGRVYCPENSEASKRKAKMNDGPMNFQEMTSEREITNGAFINEPEEFLKITKQSEYSVVDQLNRTPARISLLALLLNSESHRESLLKALSQSYVSRNISVVDMDHIVGSISAANYITFADEEIPTGMRGVPKALHITTRCKGYTMARVLIDNGSALNVMPLRSLQKLPVDLSYIQSSNLIVRAFDGTRRELYGTIEIPLQVGPVTFELVFQVMDINPSYTCLLGRPWLHLAGAIPSTLHQKVKFRVEKIIVTVRGEEDIMVTQSSDSPYIEAAEEVLDCSFRSFEIAEVMSEKGASQSSEGLTSQKRQMRELGWSDGKGLGKNLQGNPKLIDWPHQDNTFGLGFKPSWKDKQQMKEKKKARRLAKMDGVCMEEEKRLKFPPISQTFVSAGWVNLNRYGQAPISVQFVQSGLQNLVICAVDDEVSDRLDELIYVAEMDTELDNWSVVEIPAVFSSSEQM